jgi:RNA polymerase sigma-70 factor (ECF subfamily)
LAGRARGAFERLPPGQRRAVELRVLDDLGYEDVARALGSSEASARTRVCRGLSTLRRTLRGETA